MSNVAKQDNERLWYPLDAIPGILTIFVYTTPGLVPSRDELYQGHSIQYMFFSSSPLQFYENSWDAIDVDSIVV